MKAAAGSASLLIELGTEELPPAALDALGAAFAEGIGEGLQQRGLEVDATAVRAYNSPRRLAVWIADVAFAQTDQQHERRGPALSAGLDPDGKPTRALLGFAQSCAVDVAQLETLETDKGAWFVHRAIKAGQATAALLPEIVAETLKALPIPRPMRWGDHDYAFVRPVHWLVMLHGDQVVEMELFGVTSGRMSRGHRFHHPQPVHIVDADSWLDSLRTARVLADPAERRARVRDEVARATVCGMSARLGGSLLDEITNLTEWPVAIACTFDRAFLDVPSAVLVTTMETNQKFVPVFDAEEQLTEHFVGVANIVSKDPSEIRRGYERVIRPRFADAKFFFDEDLKTPLAAHMQALNDVTYQQALGSLWDKTVRVAELARAIANRLRDGGIEVDGALATRAASLCRCDLLTRMVGEFPELQGVMGRRYAEADGEHAEVSAALDEFYAPRFAGDHIAQGRLGQVLSVAERIDTLAGIFAVGQRPSGNKDPFALRRAALGLARTLIEGDLPLDLKAQLAEAFAALPESAFSAAASKGKDSDTKGFDLNARRAALSGEVYEFILDRMRGYYTEQGLPTEAFEAVRALAPTDLSDFDQRLRAVVEFAQLPEAQALARANKRIGNILRQADAQAAAQVDIGLLEAGAESELATAVQVARDDTASLIAARDHVGLLKRLALLRGPIDRYFDAVMVMADDARVRSNRLALLADVRNLFLRVADIALLPVV